MNTEAVRGIDTKKKHFLGRRAFALFLFKRIKFSLFLFGLTAIVWYSERWIRDPYSGLWMDYGAKLLLLFGLAYLALIFFRTYLEYHSYTYTFTEEAFVMTYGYIIRNEIAALYHQIQNVNIKRAVSDRLIGVSQLVIVMAGLDREGHHTQIVLPGVGKTKAKLVQKELLVRAHEQAGSQSNPAQARVS